MNEYFVILTVQFPTRVGFGLVTSTSTVEVGPDGTRAGLLDWMRTQLPEEARSGDVIFFSAEPNRIGGAS